MLEARADGAGNVVFAGMILVWLSAALTSVIRGCLIFGLGPFPALGIAGGGVAPLTFYLAANVVLGWYLHSGRAGLRVHAACLRWPLFREILRIEAVAAVTSLQSAAVARTRQISEAALATRVRSTRAKDQCRLRRSSARRRRPQH